MKFNKSVVPNKEIGEKNFQKIIRVLLLYSELLSILCNNFEKDNLFLLSNVIFSYQPIFL